MAVGRLICFSKKSTPLPRYQCNTCPACQINPKLYRSIVSTNVRKNMFFSSTPVYKFSNPWSCLSRYPGCILPVASNILPNNRFSCEFIGKNEFKLALNIISTSSLKKFCPRSCLQSILKIFEPDYVRFLRRMSKINFWSPSSTTYNFAKTKWILTKFSALKKERFPNILLPKDSESDH